MIKHSIKCLSCAAVFLVGVLPLMAVEYTAEGPQSGATGTNNLPITAQPFDFSTFSIDIDEITSMTLTLTLTGGDTAPNGAGSEGSDVNQIVLKLDGIATELRLNGFPGDATVRLSFDFVPENAAEILVALQKDSALNATIVDILPGNNQMHLPSATAILTIRGRSTRDSGFGLPTLAAIFLISGSCFAIRRKNRILPVIAVLAVSHGVFAQAPPDIFWTASGSGGNIYSLSLSPDGKFMASASDDGNARITRLSDGSLLRIFRGHGNTILKGIAYSPNGELAVSAGNDGKGIIWRISDGATLHLLEGHAGVIHGVAFSKDGQTVATAGEDKTAKIWRVSDGSLVRTLTGHVSGVRTVAFSPNGQYIATGSADRNAKVWRTSDGGLVKTLTGSMERLNSVDFSVDSTLLATGGADDRIRLWRISDGVRLRSLIGHTGDVTVVRFLPDGQRIASGGTDHRIRIWRISDGVQENAVETTNQVLSLSNLNSWPLLAVGSGAGLVIWNIDTGTLVRTITGHYGPVTSAAVSPDGTLLATGGDDKTARIWRLSDGKQMQILIDSMSGISSVTWSPDGQFLATGTVQTGNRYDYKIRIWRVSDGVLVRTLTGHTNFVQSVAFSPDGSLLASGSSDLTWKLWDPNTGDLVRTVAGHTGGVYSVTFSPDGQSVATGSYDYTSRVWRRSDGGFLRSLPEHGFLVRSVAFSPDGNVIATASADNTVQISEVTTGNLVFALNGHTGPVRSVTFTPDGEFILSGSEDGSLRVWNRLSGLLFQNYIDGSASGIYSVDTARTGGFFAYGRTDGSTPVAGTFEDTPLPATAFSITKGTLGSGNLNSLHNNDDDRLVITMARPFNLSDPSCQIVIDGLANTENPSVLSFELDSSSTGTPSAKILQRVEFFDFDSNSWVMVDERQPSFVDSGVMRGVLVDAVRFVQPTTRTVRARVSWFDLGIANLTWAARIDRWRWIER